MADYKESTSIVQQWQRCYRVVCENSLGGGLRVDFLEEGVRSVNGAIERASVPGCSLSFDPAGLIPVRDPLTGDLVDGAQVAQADIYALLYSAYRHAAALRDGAAKAPT